MSDTPDRSVPRRIVVYQSACVVGLAAVDKVAALRAIVPAILGPFGYDPAAVAAATADVVERDDWRPTGIGLGFATPEGLTPVVRAVHAGWFALATPIDWGAVDGRPVDLVYCHLAPVTGSNRVLCLAKTSMVIAKWPAADRGPFATADDLRRAVGRAWDAVWPKDAGR